MYTCARTYIPRKHTQKHTDEKFVYQKRRARCSLSYSRCCSKSHVRIMYWPSSIYYIILSMIPTHDDDDDDILQRRHANKVTLMSGCEIGAEQAASFFLPRGGPKKSARGVLDFVRKAIFWTERYLNIEICYFERGDEKR